MKRYRGLTGFLGVAVLAMVGCSPDIVDPGWHLYKLDGAYSVASSVEFMTAAGCRSLGGHRTIGAIVVARPDTGFNLFDCKGLSRDSLRKLTREYRHLLVEAKLHGASLVVPPGDGTGYYQLVDFNQVCGDANSGGSGGRYYSDSTYVLPELGVTATCWNVYTYRWVSYGGTAAGTAPDGSTPGGSGFPIGPPPTKSTPYPPPPPALQPENVQDFPDTGCTILTASHCPGRPVPPDSMKLVRAAINSLANDPACAAVKAGLNSMADGQFYSTSALPAAPGSTRIAQIGYEVSSKGSNRTVVFSSAVIVLSHAAFTQAYHPLIVSLAHEYMHMYYFSEFGQYPGPGAEQTITARATACLP